MSDIATESYALDYLVVLGLPLVGIRSVLKPLLVLGDGEEILLFLAFRDLRRHSHEHGLQGTNESRRLTLTMGVTNSTRNLGTFSKDG